MHVSSSWTKPCLNDTSNHRLNQTSATMCSSILKKQRKHPYPVHQSAEASASCDDSDDGIVEPSMFSLRVEDNDNWDQNKHYC